MQGPCVGWGVTSNIEVHHVKKLSKTVKAKNSVRRMMSAMKRKQVFLCTKSQKDIRSGVFGENKSPRKAK